MQFIHNPNTRNVNPILWKCNCDGFMRRLRHCVRAHSVGDELTIRFIVVVVALILHVPLDNILIYAAPKHIISFQFDFYYKFLNVLFDRCVNGGVDETEREKCRSTQFMPLESECTLTIFYTFSRNRVFVVCSSLPIVPFFPFSIQTVFVSLAGTPFRVSRVRFYLCINYKVRFASTQKKFYGKMGSCECVAYSAVCLEFFSLQSDCNRSSRLCPMNLPTDCLNLFVRAFRSHPFHSCENTKNGPKHFWAPKIMYVCVLWSTWCVTCVQRQPETIRREFVTCEKT